MYDKLAQGKTFQGYFTLLQDFINLKILFKILLSFEKKDYFLPFSESNPPQKEIKSKTKISAQNFFVTSLNQDFILWIKSPSLDIQLGDTSSGGALEFFQSFF